MTVFGLEAGIVAADGESLATFYETGLGFSVDRVLEFPQGVVRRMRNGDAQLKIFEPAETVTAPGAEGWNAVAGFRYAALHVDDAGAVVEAAVRAGASVITEVTHHRPGAAFALIADPDGNVWEILEEAVSPSPEEAGP